MHRPVNILTRFSQSGNVSMVTLGFRTYDEKYQQEMGDDAQFWKVYRDEAIKFDTDIINEWNRMLDWLLVYVRINFYPVNGSCSRALA